MAPNRKSRHRFQPSFRTTLPVCPRAGSPIVSRGRVSAPPWSGGTHNKVTSISGQSQVEEKHTNWKTGDMKWWKSLCLPDPSAPGRANGVKFVKLSCASDSHWAPQMLWASRAAILRAAMCAEVFRQSVTWTRWSDPLAATGEQLTEIYLADVTHPKPSACTAQQNRRRRKKTFSRASLSSACHIFNILGFKKDILHFTFGTRTDLQSLKRHLFVHRSELKGFTKDGVPEDYRRIESASKKFKCKKVIEVWGSWKANDV